MNARRRVRALFLAAALATAGGSTTALAAEPAPKTAPKDIAPKEAAPKAAGNPAPAKGSTPLPMAGRFKQVQERIAALYQHRNEPPPPPSPITNPFRNPGALMLGSDKPLNSDPNAAKKTALAEGETAPLTDAELLERGAETLRISGIFEVGEKIFVVINARPFKPGDVVQGFVRGEAVFLRIKEIGKRTVTFTLNKAETTVAF
jgi:hypothetical protein